MFKESTQELPVLILPDWVNLSGSLTFQSWLYPNFREAGQTWRGWFLGTLWVWGSSGGDRQLQLRWLSCFMSPAMCVWPVKAVVAVFFCVSWLPKLIKLLAPKTQGPPEKESWDSFTQHRTDTLHLVLLLACWTALKEELPSSKKDISVWCKSILISVIFFFHF